MDIQAVTGLGIDDRAGDPMAKGWLVDVGGNELVRLRKKVLRIEILAVDKRRQPTRGDLVSWDRSVLMSVVAHAVAAVLNWRGHMIVRLNRRVARKAFDLQIDIANGHLPVPLPHVLEADVLEILELLVG